MYAIISELDEDAAVQVMRLWRQLNQACGLEGIFNFPNPHFTWLVAADFSIEKVAASVGVIAEQTADFQVRTSGLGIFPGESPVLYLPVIKSSPLMQLHQILWDQVLPAVENVSSYYAPEQWVPHITLALMDLNQENLTCAINSIAYEPIELISKVDNLMIVEQEGEQTGETLHRFALL